MPSQNRPLETATPPPSPPPPPEEEKPDDSLRGSENHNQKLSDNEKDSEDSSDSSDEEIDEFIVVNLGEIRKEVQCPICLGIIRKTRTVMECLHRFCRECIDKSMRLGNNECPACRTHCASRRSLRDDPNYDALIAALYPDIDKYEEEELAFHEEEKARNKQIQDSISQTFRRQAEALGKKRTGRVSAAAFSRRQSTYRNLRGRRTHRASEYPDSDEDEGTNGSKDSSSAEECSPEVKSKRHKRWGGGRSSEQSSGANADEDNDPEANRELQGTSVGLIGGTEILAWGRGGLRSNTRHGGNGWVNGKLSRNSRLTKLREHLKSATDNDEVLKINLQLVSLIDGNIPCLKRPYLCCSQKSSVRHLSQYVAMQTSTEADRIEILIVKDIPPVNITSSFKGELGIVDPCLNEMQLLNEDQTLGEIHANFTQQNLVLAYREKAQG
ncbi:Putative E3 ubiquitin-protein ligase RING1a [Striga hermonthica]|uniref:E3 ubiquitin-protein ligase RING1a n=1 Tax=Striga hermonthica TaxID=68872 RepID=A0A9N7MYN3_STRHE|nr:Putative E3 ubiquitin-protein ligase RING1a [Striga hermonthica]